MIYLTEHVFVLQIIGKILQEDVKNVIPAVENVMDLQVKTALNVPLESTFLAMNVLKLVNLDFLETFLL